MGRMNVYLNPEEDKKLEQLKKRFNIKSKEEVLKRLIKQFPEENSELDSKFDIEKEINMEDLL